MDVCMCVSFLFLIDDFSYFRIRQASKGTQSETIPPVQLLQAIALFSFTSNDPEVLSLTRGQRYTVLDQVGDWFYGFLDADSDRKGLIAKSYVEVRPHGALLPGVMLPSDWDKLKTSFINLELNAGSVLIEEGNPVAAGHLWFVANGELSVTVKFARLFKIIGIVLLIIRL
jgi:hypothetical protein